MEQSNGETELPTTDLIEKDENIIKSAETEDKDATDEILSEEKVNLNTEPIENNEAESKEEKLSVENLPEENKLLDNNKQEENLELKNEEKGEKEEDASQSSKIIDAINSEADNLPSGSNDIKNESEQENENEEALLEHEELDTELKNNETSDSNFPLDSETNATTPIGSQFTNNASNSTPPPAVESTTPKSAKKIKTPKSQSANGSINNNQNGNTPNKSANSNGNDHSNSKRRKKDPAAPKAPLNGYLIYFNDERADMRLKNPNMGFGELTKIIALKWKDLPADQKNHFINQAETDKARYIKEMAEYKKSDTYKNYVKEVSNAKMAKNEENKHLSNASSDHFNDGQQFNLNDSNTAGFDIPIFTEEFIEHCKSREHEMRQIRKEISEFEQQNSVLHKHIEMLKNSSNKCDHDIENYKSANIQLQKKLDSFRQAIINCNIQLPNQLEQPTHSNIDEYIMQIYSH